MSSVQGVASCVFMAHLLLQERLLLQQLCCFRLRPLLVRRLSQQAVAVGLHGRRELPLQGGDLLFPASARAAASQYA